MEAKQFNLGKPGFDSFLRTLLQQVYSILLKMVALLSFLLFRRSSYTNVVLD